MMTRSEAAATNHTIFSTRIDLLTPSRVERTTSRSRALRTGFWSFTTLFCLQMAFTAYAQLALPQVTEMFHHLGFPDYFRVELSWAKLVGVVVLLAPVSARLKEWAYAGFAFTLVSALIAHFTLGDGPAVWSWAAGTGVLLAGSYFFWLRVQSSRPRAEV
ncbi:MAG TPA: DoxX family protein [Gemmatimonadaceae bacterium]|jgi:hypothetical protein